MYRKKNLLQVAEISYTLHRFSNCNAAYFEGTLKEVNVRAKESEFVHYW